MRRDILDLSHIKSGYLAATIFYALEDWNALCEVTLLTKSPRHGLHVGVHTHHGVHAYVQ